MTLAPVRLKALTVSTDGLADKRQVLVTVSTSQLDRVKDVMVQAGIDLANYRRTKSVLWNHDQNNPIAQCLSVDVAGENLVALVQFPDEGVNAESDRIYALIKAGIVNAASIGFITIEAEPLDGRNPKNGMRITKCELLEFSFVSVPANPGALIQERAMPVASIKTSGGKISLKGLYAVGQLAEMLSNFGYMAQGAAFERDNEGDGSAMPEMLAGICRQVGEALQAMTAEEIKEMLEALPGASSSGDVVEKSGDRIVAVLKAFKAQAGLDVNAKAGRTLSAATVSGLDEACKSIAAGHALVAKGHGSIKAMIAQETDPESDDIEAKAAAALQLKNVAAKAKRQRQCELAAAAA